MRSGLVRPLLLALLPAILQAVGVLLLDWSLALLLYSFVLEGIVVAGFALVRSVYGIERDPRSLDPPWFKAFMWVLAGTIAGLVTCAVWILPADTRVTNQVGAGALIDGLVFAWPPALATLGLQTRDFVADLRSGALRSARSEDWADVGLAYGVLSRFFFLASSLAIDGGSQGPSVALILAAKVGFDLVLSSVIVRAQARRGATSQVLPAR